MLEWRTTALKARSKRRHWCLTRWDVALILAVMRLLDNSIDSSPPKCFVRMIANWFACDTTAITTLCEAAEEITLRASDNQPSVAVYIHSLSASSLLVLRFQHLRG
jgi:hypothetical protein